MVHRNDVNNDVRNCSRKIRRGFGAVETRELNGKILPMTMLILCTFPHSQEQRSEVEILETLY